MSEIFSTLAPRLKASGNPPPEWSLYGDGHVIAGAIVERDVAIEAHILLDGTVLYRSRHASRAVAEQELGALRGQWARQGWVDVR